VRQMTGILYIRAEAEMVTKLRAMRERHGDKSVSALIRRLLREHVERALKEIDG